MIWARPATGLALLCLATQLMLASAARPLLGSSSIVEQSSTRRVRFRLHACMDHATPWAPPPQSPSLSSLSTADASFRLRHKVLSQITHAVCLLTDVRLVDMLSLATWCQTCRPPLCRC